MALRWGSQWWTAPTRALYPKVWLLHRSCFSHHNKWWQQWISLNYSSSYYTLPLGWARYIQTRIVIGNRWVSWGESSNNSLLLPNNLGPLSEDKQINTGTSSEKQDTVPRKTPSSNSFLLPFLYIIKLWYGLKQAVFATWTGSILSSSSVPVFLSYHNKTS